MRDNWSRTRVWPLDWARVKTTQTGPVSRSYVTAPVLPLPHEEGGENMEIERSTTCTIFQWVISRKENFNASLSDFGWIWQSQTRPVSLFLIYLMSLCGSSSAWMVSQRFFAERLRYSSQMHCCRLPQQTKQGSLSRLPQNAIKHDQGFLFHQIWSQQCQKCRIQQSNLSFPRSYISTSVVSSLPLIQTDN